jgi:dTDP-4-dehydrorhamnose 3,5-epimerase
MRVTPTELPEVLLIEPQVFGDARGYFFESYSERRYAEQGIGARFVQDNVSRSTRGILRGLHLQSPPSAQGKLVHVLAGEVYDVAVDARPGSPRFGRSVGLTLSSENQRQLWVPPGFAHGFCVVSESALFAYKCTAYYDPKAELSIAHDDPDLAIAWPIATPQLSSKDAAGLRLRDVPAVRLLAYEGAPGA